MYFLCLARRSFVKILFDYFRLGKCILNLFLSKISKLCITGFRIRFLIIKTQVYSINCITQLQQKSIKIILQIIEKARKCELQWFSERVQEPLLVIKLQRQTIGKTDTVVNVRFLHLIQLGRFIAGTCSQNSSQVWSSIGSLHVDMLFVIIIVVWVSNLTQQYFITFFGIQE
ncbi:Hypothetical_protein [Hexamita inflata]|uniref:Hypothetical_protein n=1 Tax=Hexamita inflata TaxID=28002 RepID=A0AA86UJA3_9EUKA|nr:Hypothetical protein HINF_LOCUS45569 [Hexamita inflata]